MRLMEKVRSCSVVIVMARGATWRVFLRFGVVVGLVAAVTGLAAVPVAQAGNTYLRVDSSCNGRSDPANVVVLDPRTRTLLGGDAAGAIARDDWNGGLGSSSAWYLFSGTGACRPQDAWATNSILSGHHIRFFEPVDDADRAVAGAHHDFLCGLGHSANQFIESARAFDHWLAGWVDVAGQDAYAHLSFRLDRAYTTYLKCGQIVPDDGYTAVLQQMVPVAYPTSDPPPALASRPSHGLGGAPPDRPRLRIGRTPRGRVWVRATGDADLTVIAGRAAIDRFAGGGQTITRYMSAADLWADLSRRYRASRPNVLAAARLAPPHALPSHLAGAVTHVHDTSTSLQTLAQAARTDVISLGSQPLGLPLARTALVTVHDGRRVYRTAATIYGGDNGNAPQLVIDNALPGSATERQYRDLLRSRPHIVVGNRRAARINDLQLIVRFADKFVAVTAPYPLTASQWDAMVQRLTITDVPESAHSN